MRWRPASPGSSPYITAAGAAALRTELDRLWREERPRVTAQVQAAAGNGDRSENGDYIYGKRRLREIDRRVRYLRHRLQTLIVVVDPPADCGRVRFGAWVTLRDAVDATLTYRLVGADEIDPQRGWISIDAPLARALLGRANGDQVTVEGPGGAADYKVVALTYGEEDPTR